MKAARLTLYFSTSVTFFDKIKKSIYATFVHNHLCKRAHTKPSLRTRVAKRAGLQIFLFF